MHGWGGPGEDVIIGELNGRQDSEVRGGGPKGTNGNFLFPELFLEDCGPSTL